MLREGQPIPPRQPPTRENKEAIEEHAGLGKRLLGVGSPLSLPDGSLAARNSTLPCDAPKSLRHFIIQFPLVPRKSSEVTSGFEEVGAGQDTHPLRLMCALCPAVLLALPALQASALTED